MCALPPKLPPAQERDTSAYDAWLAQLAEDTKQYVYAVFKTLVATVPKAIIHAQVPAAASAVRTDRAADQATGKINRRADKAISKVNRRADQGTG